MSPELLRSPTESHAFFSSSTDCVQPYQIVEGLTRDEATVILLRNVAALQCWPPIYRCCLGLRMMIFSCARHWHDHFVQARKKTMH